MPALPPSLPHPLVVQHNALVNAQFSLSTTESRLFLAMLARISPEDTEFAKCQVDIYDIVEATSNNYAHVRKMLDSFGGCKLRLEKLNPDGRRRQKRIYTVIPLVEYAEYREGEGIVEARFNNRLLPYLLELRDNFTKAQLAELLKLKSNSSFRVYWLLREYAAFGKRTILVSELKAVLGLSEEYDRFNNFRVRILDRAQQELADTDTAFTYKTIKTGREVTAIEFRFNLRLEEPATPAAPLAEWEEAVLAAGVAMGSLPQIKARLDAGDYEVDYVRYVLATVKGQLQSGKVKREGGAVFKALVDGYMLPAFRKAQQRQQALLTRPAARSKGNPALAAQVKKLSGELEDARNSLRFAQTAVIYTDETRAVAVREIQERIVRLEQQRQQLTA